MGDGIYTALSGALAQQHSLDVIANNVANVNTAGFRGDRVVFGEMLAGAQSAAPVDPRQPAPPRTDQFVRVEANALDRTGGMLRDTGNTLDFGINGPGYFVVRTAQGDRLTRSGNFVLNDDGQLSTVDGGAVLADSGRNIVFPKGVKDIQVTGNGVVRANGQDIATLAIRDVTDPRQITREGTTTYTVAQGSELIKPQGTQIVQGHLEASNVNPVAGLNELITVQRSFDALQKTIETFQQIDQRTVRDIGNRQ
ncbi:MAG TPA: flagellar hook-basal body protein [Polyangiaceae bacterium]|nr:flagellar hook-basal body protein [Polyangiaceae bacterium]